MLKTTVPRRPSQVARDKAQLNSVLVGHIAKLGIPLQRIQRVTGIQYATIHGWVHGTVNMSLETLTEVAEALGYTVRLKVTAPRTKRMLEIPGEAGSTVPVGTNGQKPERARRAT